MPWLLKWNALIKKLKFNSSLLVHDLGLTTAPAAEFQTLETPCSTDLPVTTQPLITAMDLIVALQSIPETLVDTNHYIALAAKIKTGPTIGKIGNALA